MDRVGIHIEAPAVKYNKWSSSGGRNISFAIRERVDRRNLDVAEIIARRHRYHGRNSDNIHKFAVRELPRLWTIKYG